MRRIALISWLVIMAASLGGGVWAAQRIVATHCMATAPAADLASLQPMEDYPFAKGRVVAVDAKDGRVTIMHHGVARLYLDPGTYIFHVDDRAQLAGLTPGDRIEFKVAREGKHYAITRIDHDF
jgi:Cu/Ag efflux protein CusF